MNEKILIIYRIRIEREDINYILKEIKDEIIYRIRIEDWESLESISG